jgi:hypothetical protein
MDWFLGYKFEYVHVSILDCHMKWLKYQKLYWTFKIDIIRCSQEELKLLNFDKG